MQCLYLSILATIVGIVGVVTVPESAQAQVPEIVGNIDGFNQGELGLQGWACLQGSPSPVDVHVYAGGPYGTGTLVAYGIANRPNEPAVTASCGAGANHRYFIPLHSNVVPEFAGQQLY